MHKELLSTLENKTKNPLVNLYVKSQYLKTASITRNLSAKPTHRLELSIFKEQLRNNTHKEHAYHQYSSKVRYYRSIFFSLALLFISLGAIIFFQNIVFTNFLFGDLREFIKNIICAINACLAIFAAGVGYSLCIAKEATENLANKARRKLTHLYTKKRIENGVRTFIVFPEFNDKGRFLKAAYKEACEKIDEKKAATADLLLEIRVTSGFDTANHELLFSQALAEYDEQLRECIQHFKELE